MTDLTDVVLAEIARRREVAVTEWDRANLYAWEAVVRPHAVNLMRFAYHSACFECDDFWPCRTWHTAARLFLTAEQLAEYGVEQVSV